MADKDERNFVISGTETVPISGQKIAPASSAFGMPRIRLSDYFNGQTFTTKELIQTQVPDDLVHNAAMLDQSRNDRLSILREKNAYVPIMMIPTSCNCVFLAIGADDDIPIPSGAKFMMLMSERTYYMSLQGKAFTPTAAIKNGTAPFYRPDGIMFYVEEILSVSVINTGNGTNTITASFYF